MTTFARMTLAEMEAAFPDEWVLIIDPDESDSGEVAAHSGDRREVDAVDARLTPSSAAVYFMPGPQSRSYPRAFML